ncbi:MAG: hypothetical protein OHM56_02985 [Spiroplasma phoeniceum]|nr:MAG: hypothetical protein OHM57_02435 [Spiroplasma phoeniceum]UZQ32930.1 MAG: hypothetical protein OHM56_02985 [Spiroplasma phoeniceum]
MQQKYLCKLVYINQKYNIQLQNTEKAIFVLLPEPYQEYGIYMPKTMLVSSQYWKSIGIKLFPMNTYKVFVYNQKFKKVIKSNFKSLTGSKIISIFQQAAVDNKKRYLESKAKINESIIDKHQNDDLIIDLEKW